MKYTRQPLSVCLRAAAVNVIWLVQGLTGLKGTLEVTGTLSRRDISTNGTLYDMIFLRKYLSDQGNRGDALPLTDVKVKLACWWKSSIQDSFRLPFRVSLWRPSLFHYGLIDCSFMQAVEIAVITVAF